MVAIWLPLGLLALVLALLVHYSTRNFSHWKDKGVTFVRAFPFVGSFWTLVTLQEHATDHFWRLYKKFKSQKFIGYYQGSVPGLVVMDPGLVKHIVVKDFSHFVDHGFEIDESLDPLQARNLFNVEGEKWRQLRNKISPTFTSGKMKGMYPLVEVCANNFERFIQQHQGQNIDIKDLLARFTTDVIGSCVFGLNINSIKDPQDQFRIMGRRMLEADLIQGIKNAIVMFMPKIAIMLRITVFPEDVTKFFYSLVDDIIGKRVKFGNTRKDFMQLLIQLKEKGMVTPEDDEHSHEKASMVDYNITDVDIVAQALVFFTAGFDTSSSTLTFALMEMARAPLVQQKARENIEQVLERHNGQMSYQALQEMTYLDWIMQEALRMYPVSPTLIRVCTKNYMIPESKVLVEKGTMITIPIHAMQMDSEYFEDPKEFNPDRFADEKLLRKNQFVYMPFGEGPRQCIGMRFAKLQSKLGLYTILRNFEVLQSAQTVYPPVWDPKQFLLASKDNIFVKFSEIKK